MTSRKAVFSAAVTLGISLVAGLWMYRDKTSSSAAPAPTTASPATTTAPSRIDTPPPASPDTEKAAFLTTLGQQLHARWDERLTNPYWRMKMLNDLLALFQKKFGDSWQTELEAFLRVTFPQWAEDLIKKMLALEEYNRWVEQLKSTMEYSTTKERQTALWEKRVELFGEEAYVIWEAAFKNEQLQSTLENVNAATGGFDEKLAQYLQGMRNVFGTHIIGPDQPHTTQMMSQFLQLPNVQVDLQQLPETERYEKLREFRKAMGLNEEALQRWDALDQERMSLRANGQHYMEQRTLLESRYQGDALQQALRRLQDDVFSPEEATFIRNEESEGFYRFQQPQVIGIN